METVRRKQQSDHNIFQIEQDTGLRIATEKWMSNVLLVE